MIALPEIWQMWSVFGIVAVGVFFYVRESFTIEAISVGIILALMVFFHLFGAPGTIKNGQLLSGFAAPALVTIMALLVVGQGMFQTGALEGPILKINSSLDKSPRRTLLMVFTIAFAVSMFMNNTPVVVMFIPVMAAMAARLRKKASRYMMPLSFISILAGMTTLIGSSTNLLVNDVLVRTTEFELSFFSQFVPGMTLAIIGAIYIIIMAPILLPEREGLDAEITSTGHQYIAQIQVSPNHPLIGAKPVAGLFPTLRDVTVRMVQRGERSMLPPFEDALESGDILIVAATRGSLSKLLSSQPEYLRGMLNIGGFEAEADTAEPIVISEAVVAPGSRMIGRTIEQIGFRRQTGTLVLGVQRRSRMIRKRMLEIRLEAGDVLLLFGYDSDMRALRNDRDLLLLDWSMVELQDIRKSFLARVIFIVTIAFAATSILPIEIAALGGALGMIATGCLNVRQAIRALDMRIFLLIGAAFAMGLSLEQTGGAAHIGQLIVNAFMPFGNQILIGAVFIVIAFFTNIISNSAAALLFSPIALEISAQTGIDPIAMVLTVIFAANCCFATPIAYQTNLLVLGPGHYRFGDFIRFGGPLILLLWISYTLLAPVFFQL
ncbi:membrane protein [Litorimonas cladophorae]|uniref:Membrane protein n=1 Tax=Litorimonas cladophorae TaxID=1220491 RepID=A0A918NDP8_9PROT|nr:SLC13 family permease [Litorimonas cladophorae]GGX59667.1 membrane protein [Litorimonas cladophorae]